MTNNSKDSIMIRDSTIKYAIHNRQTNKNCPRSQHKIMKSPPKSREVSQCKSRRTCSCRSPTRSSGKIYRAISSPPHTTYKSGKRNPEIQTSITVESTLSCQNVGDFPSAQLEQFTKNLMETEKVVNILKEEILTVKHQLHHVLQNQNSLLPPQTKKPFPIVPVENSRFNIKQFEKLQQENNHLNREKQAIETNKILLDKSWVALLKARDIVSDYDKKVCLLHTQVHKSLKAIKLHKNKFCECIKEKEEKIKSLEESNFRVARMLEERNSVVNDHEMERDILNVNSTTLKENNEYLKQDIASFRQQLLDSTAEVLKQKDMNLTLKKELSDLNDVYQELISKTKKENEGYEFRIKSNEIELKGLSSKINQLSEKLLKAEQRKNILKNKSQELQGIIQRYGSFGSSLKQLENDCKSDHLLILDTLEAYDKEKQDMKNLIEELIGAAKQKILSLEQITEINKEQENVNKSQIVALLGEEEQLQITESETERFKMKNNYLMREMEELKKNIFELSNKEPCLCISKELIQTR